MDDQEKVTNKRIMRQKFKNFLILIGFTISAAAMIVATGQLWGLVMLVAAYFSVAYFLLIKKIPRNEVGLVIVISSLIFISFIRYEINNDLIVYDFNKKVFEKKSPPIAFINPLTQRVVSLKKNKTLIIDKSDYHFFIKTQIESFQYEIGYLAEIKYQEEDILRYVKRKIKKGISPISFVSEMELIMDNLVKNLPNNFEVDRFATNRDITNKIEKFFKENEIKTEVIFFRITNVQKTWKL